MSVSDDPIALTYNTDRPTFAFICGGLRRISVNCNDMRARTVLLSKGFNYYSKVPYFVYSCLSELPVHTFVDIGANYGECMFSVPLHSSCRVMGFEVNEDLVAHLERSRLYNDDVKDVTIFPLAIADVIGGEQIIRVDKEWSGKTTISCGDSHEDSDLHTFRSVQTTTIDNVLGDAPREDLVLIKIDIQGWEPLALKGASESNDRLDNIVYIMEFSEEHLSEAGWDPRDFFDELLEGFAIYKLTARGLHAVSNYEDLRSVHRGEELKKQSETLHLDLVLTKLTDPELDRCFQRRIVAVDPYEAWSDRKATRNDGNLW